MRHLLYVIGQPGSGKSTLVEGLTEGLPDHPAAKPFAHVVWGSSPPVVELGARRGAFSGTDALSMSVQPKVLAYLEASAQGLVLGEGDRLANGKFFKSVLELGWTLNIVRLLVSGAVAAERRRARAAELGTAPQGDVWLKGRITKVTNLAFDFAGYVTEVDADQLPMHVLRRVYDLDDPVIAALRSAPSG